MNYKIKIEGQEIDMPEEIAGDDDALKSALSPYFPGAANAKFIRSEPKDDVITVTVVKQAGTKGAGISFMIFDEYPRIVSKSDVERTKSFLAAMTKPGNDDQVLRKLIKAPQGVNPVVELHRSLEGKTLNQMTVDQLLVLDDQIDGVIHNGTTEKSLIESSLSLLIRIDPVPAKIVMAGF